MSKFDIYVPARESLKESLRGLPLSILRRENWQIFCLDGMDEHDGYEHLRRGRCMLCGGELGEDTLVLIDEQGILALFCETQCLQDMHVIPWLENTLTEMVSRLDPNNKEEDDAEDQ